MPSHRSTTDPDRMIRMVDEWLTAAVARGASDLHAQPRSDHWDVSLRIDGVLHHVGNFDRHSDFDPVARLMAMAGLPSYRGGVPQEGLLRWEPPSGPAREMRLGIFPTVHGNRAAVRIMGDPESVRNLEQLGLDEGTLQQLRNVCRARTGWMLIAGPAGSGKTTTLYACLSHLSTADDRRSVLAIEDPIESVIDTISQSQIQPESGMTLASAMRAAVRQDAEVLSVSEIRDVETAEAVLSASMTGHLCFSSIHAGSIAQTLRRLVQMNLPGYAIQSGLGWILCQRLLRKTCDTCHGEPTEVAACDSCHGAGYRGRIPVAQLLSFGQEAQGASDLGHRVFDSLLHGFPANKIDEMIADAGIKSLRQRGDDLVARGLTDQRELFRVLGSNE